MVHRLMVKPVYTLAMRILSTNGTLVSSVRRIQSGFLAERNLQEARAYIAEMQSILDEMETTLKTPKDKTQQDGFIPLK